MTGHRRADLLPLHPRLAATLALVALLAAPAVRAAAPDHRWRTLTAPHFEVHFHEGLYEVALRAARGLERAHERLVPLLGAEPDRRTQVTISDDSDDANGSAATTLRPRIDLLAEPPDDLSVLNDYDDYVFLLVAHEYTHVLHLGTVGGLKRALNAVFGDLFTPNGNQPRFVTEGIATYEESHLSASGRLRSAIFDMYLRADVLEDRLLTLDELSSGPQRWPRGTAAYLYGGRFVQYLVETRGDEVLLRYSHEYGSHLIPFAMNLALADSSDTDWVALWEEWRAHLDRRYREQAAAIRDAGPITEPAFVTRHGERTGGPRWAAAGGRLFYVEAGPDRRPHVRVATPSTGADEEVHDLGTSGELAPLPDGTGVIVARPELHEVYRSRGDLFLVTADGERQLTHGLRASEPELGGDGRHVTFVRRRDGRTQVARLARARLDAEPLVVHEPPRGLELFTPRVSPDGRRLVFSQHRAGPGRDLWIADLDPTGRAGSPRPLTDDTAMDIDPAWSPDGETVYFSSDRTGVFNVYAIPAGGGSPSRVTNVLTGAFQPAVSPDGTWLAWTTYHSRGFDVAAAPLASLAPVPARPFADDRPVAEPSSATGVWPVSPYDPLRSLPPQFWFPYVTEDADGAVLGALTGGDDILGLHGWALSAGGGLESGLPEAAAAYQYRGLFTPLAFTAFTGFRGVGGFGPGVNERFATANASATLPWATTRSSHELRLGTEATWLSPVDAPDPLNAPREGVATELQLGWSYGHVESSPEAISLENGFVLASNVRYGTTALGGDFAYAATSGVAAGYVRMPWSKHHVLAPALRGGLGSGDLGERRLFRMGGPQLVDPIIVLFYGGGAGAPPTQLRGYPAVAFAGSRLVIGTLEYRFPIARAAWGPYTLPLWVSWLHGAAFVEAGDAADALDLARLHPSAGAELRADLNLGYGGGVQVRLGYAYGFDLPLGGSRLFLSLGASY